MNPFMFYVFLIFIGCSPLFFYEQARSEELKPTGPEWSQLSLAGGITINQDIPATLDKIWEKETINNDRYYTKELGMTPDNNPTMFTAGHAPRYFLYKNLNTPQGVVTVSIMMSWQTCDKDRFSGQYSHQLCELKITTPSGSTAISNVCYYDVSEDPDYKSQPRPNGAFVRLSQDGKTLMFTIAEKGRARPECTRTVVIPAH